MIFTFLFQYLHRIYRSQIYLFWKQVLYSILPETPNNFTGRSNTGGIIAKSWGFRWWNVDKYYAAEGSRCSRFGIEADMKLRGS